MRRAQLDHVTLALTACLTALTCWGCEGSLENQDPGDSPALTPEAGDETRADLGPPPDADDLTGDDSGLSADQGELGPDGGKEEVIKAPHPNQIEQSRFFTCSDTGAQAPSPSRLRRINQLNWLRNTGRAKLGSAAEHNPLSHSAASPYSSYAAEDTVEGAMLGAYLNVVEEAAKPLLGDRYSESSDNPYSKAWLYEEQDALGIKCLYDGSARPERDCVERFVSLLLERAVFHRPATEREIENLTDFAMDELDEEGQPGDSAQGREETVTQIVSGAWLMTGALFQQELGAEADASGRRRLGSWEIAHAVGNALMARRPGALPTRSAKYGFKQPYNGPREGHMRDLYLAAEDGSIQDKAVLAELLRAHLSGVEISEEGEVTHVGGEDPERFDIRQEARLAKLSDGSTRSHTYYRGEYGLPEGVREFFVEYFDYASVNAELRSEAPKTSKYWTGQGPDHRTLQKLNRSRQETLLGGGAFGQSRPEADHKQQLDDFIARLVSKDEHVLKGLLTDRTYWLASNDHLTYQNPDNNDWLAGMLKYVNAPYNYDETIEYEDRTGKRWVEMPEGERAGVLTHPAWLAAHGANFENDASAIYRGKWIVEHLLCGSIPDVPITIDAQLNPDSAEESARFRVAEVTEGDGYCLSCHNMMNPLGYAFETYNHAGFVRVENHGEAKGSFGQVQFPSDITEAWALYHPEKPTWNYIPQELRGKSVQDGVELSQDLSESEQVRQCFVRHTFRYFMGRDEREEDACVLKAMDDKYVEKEGSFREMLITLLTSDAFLYRADAPD